jgi:hypothetical protein
VGVFPAAVGVVGWGVVTGTPGKFAEGSREGFCCGPQGGVVLTGSQQVSPEHCLLGTFVV